jgi:hypothetical protein
MQRYPARTACRRKAGQVLPGRKQATGFPQRQLGEHCGDPARDRLDVPGRRRLKAPGQEADLKVMQDPRPVLLVQQHVAEVRDRDAAAPAAIGVDPQRRLLGHHAAGEERRCLHPE